MKSPNPILNGSGLVYGQTTVAGTDATTKLQQNAASLKQMFDLLKGSSNPTEMMNRILANNPNTSKVLDYIRQNGNDPEKAFNALSNQMGLNPNDILSMLR